MARTVPTASPKLPLRDQIRMFLRDVPGKVPGSGSENILLDDVEFSDAEIDFAADLALSRYNSRNPPIPPLKKEQIPIDILLLGVSLFLLNAESFRQLRNQASASDSDTNLGIDDKHSSYVQFRKFMSDEFDTAITQHKVARNLGAAWGGVDSAYSLGWLWR